jgi:uncharacterized membrane protein
MEPESLIHSLPAWIDVVGLVIEILGVAVIVAGILFAGSLLVRHYTKRIDEADPYWNLKVRLGKTLLLGLEILVAADIVKTVALETTFRSVGILGLLVFIRTFLSWSLVVEIEGRWPWQSRPEVSK